MLSTSLLETWKDLARLGSGHAEAPLERSCHLRQMATGLPAPLSCGGEGHSEFGDNGSFLNCDHCYSSNLLMAWGERPLS